MARFNIRDLLGHWTKRPGPEGRMCPHACCKGKRPHPDRLPVMLSRDMLKGLTDAELMRHWDRPGVRDNERANVAIIKELDSRELREQRKAGRAARERGNRFSRQAAYRDWLESEWVKAEEDTRGSMVNKRGRAKGIDGRSLWTANQQTRNAYASEELKSYWDRHPVLTAREFTAYERRDERAVNQHNRARATRKLYGVY